MRGKAGIFLAFQYPQAIPGVSVLNFLRQALSARKGIDLSVLELRLAIMEWMERLGMDPSFVDRYLNEGFSGGEKKRNEILQMAILEPELAVLDETDSGLDIDALQVVATGVQEVRGQRPELGVLLITHYQRLLDHLQPDRVHVLIDGRIVASGGPELAERLEAEGYEAWRSDRASERRVTMSGIDPDVIKQGLPDPRAPGRRQPARLPRLGVVVAEAAVGARRHGDVLRDDLRQRPPRRVRASPPRRPRRYEEARRKVARFIGAPSAREHRVHQERHRGASTSSPTRGAGPTSARATPCCSPRWSTTPTSCRG